MRSVCVRRYKQHFGLFCESFENNFVLHTMMERNRRVCSSFQSFSTSRINSRFQDDCHKDSEVHRKRACNARTTGQRCGYSSSSPWTFIHSKQTNFSRHLALSVGTIEATHPLSVRRSSARAQELPEGRLPRNKRVNKPYHTRQGLSLSVMPVSQEYRSQGFHKQQLHIPISWVLEQLSKNASVTVGVKVRQHYIPAQ